MAVLWLDEIGSDDLDSVGGKGASLGEMTAAGLPVPPGFVVTADTYRSFIEHTGIVDELFDAVDVDTDDSTALADAEARAEELILGTELPADVRQEILEAYEDIDGDGTPDDDVFVAVRSSATAEDLPDASFAGQQETFLNVTGDALIDRVKRCWASLFTQRAIYYRQEQGFAHDAVDIAVVVQRMVDAEKSGVLFTSHPSSGVDQTIVEAAWGLGEAVVSGAVSPDNYVLDGATGDLEEITLADKKVMHVRDDETGETVEREVAEDRREARVLDDDELGRLVELGRRAESHYNQPQDVEWAIADGEVFMLQSRPITTIEDDTEATAGGEAERAESDDSGAAPIDSNQPPATTDGSGVQLENDAGDAGSGEDGDVLVNGLGASPGMAAGPVRIVRTLDELDKVSEGDIIVTEMTTPDMVPAMKRAAGIVTDEGGMTSHAAIVSRELGVPAAVGTGTATAELTDGQSVTLDGDKGTIAAGAVDTGEEATGEQAADESGPQAEVKPLTATEVKVNVSIPEAAERAAATGADGVGLLRLEHMILSLNKTPAKYIDEHGADAYVDELVDGIRTVADEFYPRPVTVRTLDAPTDEYRQLDGGDDEPHEHNPMLGYRGIRRSLDRPDIFAHELQAFASLYEMGYDNVEIMLPLVNDAVDVRRGRELMEDVGIDTDSRTWGVMVETPASALTIEEMAGEGIDFISFGTNDLTQYVLAVDRNNENVAQRFDELHPAVLSLMETAIETCRAHDIETSICGEAGSKPKMVRFLVENGITSISANIDAVRDVQHQVKRVEQKLIMDSVR